MLESCYGLVPQFPAVSNPANSRVKRLDGYSNCSFSDVTHPQHTASADPVVQCVRIKTDLRSVFSGVETWLFMRKIGRVFSPVGLTVGRVHVQTARRAQTSEWRDGKKSLQAPGTAPLRGVKP